MDDRELLELAAKAAGIERGAERADCGISITEQNGRHGYLPQWNPLTDDGDALRLAVKLELLGYPQFWLERSALHATNDIYAATRRAIVRAAAALHNHFSEN